MKTLGTLFIILFLSLTNNALWAQQETETIHGQNPQAYEVEFKSYDLIDKSEISDNEPVDSSAVRSQISEKERNAIKCFGVILGFVGTCSTALIVVVNSALNNPPKTRTIRFTL